MTTSTGVSPSVSAAEVWISMIAYTLVYAVLAVIEVKLFLTYVRRGAEPFEEPVEPRDVDEDARSSSPTDPRTVMDYALIWFCLIGLLWAGYLVLEGFDFGRRRAAARPRAGRDAADTEKRRRVMLTTIGPHWDGNEVWLLTAGGATFAAFPSGTRRCSLRSTSSSSCSWR